MKIYTAQHLWSIEHFNLREWKPKEMMTSTTFSADGHKSKWYLSLFPKGDTLLNPDDIGLFLELASEKTEVLAKAEISMYADKTLLEKLDLDWFEYTTFYSSKSTKRSYGSSCFLSRDRLDYLKGKNYTINIHVKLHILEISYQAYDIAVGDILEPEITSDKEFVNDLDILLKNELEFDTTVIIDDTEFRVHKAILRGRQCFQPCFLLTC